MAKFVAKNKESNYKVKLPNAGRVIFNGIYETSNVDDIESLRKNDFVKEIKEDTAKGGKK